MNTHAQRLRSRLDRAIRRRVSAAISNAWSGAGHPEDIPATEAEHRAARKALTALLDEIAPRDESDTTVLRLLREFCSRYDISIEGNIEGCLSVCRRQRIVESAFTIDKGIGL